MNFEHKTPASFWRLYHRLPQGIRGRADKQFELLETDPSHGSLQLKPVGKLWSARVSDSYRALALHKNNTFMVLDWSS